jgi:serine/threonine-protein kinase
VARPALAAIGAIFVVAGGAALGFALTRKPTGGMTPESTRAMDQAIDHVDSDLKSARTAVRERASTLATLLAVRAAVSANADTARDQLVVGGELKFDPKSGEVIEIGQVKAGEAPTVLVIQPEAATKSVHGDQAGGYLDLDGTKLTLTEVARVTPADARNADHGYVSVARTLDLKPAAEQLAAAGVSGHIDLAGKTIPIGKPEAGAVEKPMPLPSQPDFQIVVAVPPMTGGMPVPIAAGGGGAALVGLVLVFASMLGGKKDPALGQAPSPGSRQTQYSAPSTAQSVANGTPAPAGASQSMGASPKPMEAGAVIGRWEVIRRLGSGGMADVFLARARGEAGFEKQVAIKVMHPHLARNSRAVDHFLDEARLAARITHPNVVAIQDLGKIGDDYVIVMDYVDGVDLERLLMSARTAGRAVPLDVGLGILCRICDGLHAAHRATASDGTPMNLVHRDVKAANVLVSKQGGVKVVDFGIAKAAKQAHLTVAGETKGTPSMMAPEQRVGETVDVRADVYSVAAVGFEIVTGHGVNLDLAALAHLGVENWPHLPLPSSLRPQAPHELDGLLLGAMAFERDKRPADCAVFESAVEAIMKRHGLSATDKDIARWVAAEIEQLAPAHGGVGTDPTRQALT